MPAIPNQILTEAIGIVAGERLRPLATQIILGVALIWLASQYIEGVSFKGTLGELLFTGAALGVVNFFIRPIVNILTLPLRIFTLGLFAFVINMLMIWTIDIISANFDVVGVIPLFWTAMLFWGLGFIIPALIPKKKRAAGLAA